MRIRPLHFSSPRECRRRADRLFRLLTPLAIDELHDLFRLITNYFKGGRSMPTADWRLQHQIAHLAAARSWCTALKLHPFVGHTIKSVSVLWIQEAVMISRKPIIFLAPLALAAACSTTGTYDEPYALVEPGMRSAVRKEMPVSINAVDGQTTLNARYYPTPLTHVEWEPVIYPEPIGECIAKFPQKTAQN